MAYEVETRPPDVTLQSEWSSDECDAIIAECHHILSHHAFRKSKRCVTLFQYLVDRSLAGNHEALKERVLGMEVFGRSADYDTNADPVVRMTANEIRKRLAQYYQEDDGGSGIRVHLFPGSYCLHFELPSETPAPITPETGMQTATWATQNKGQLKEEKSTSNQSRRTTRRRWILLLISVGVAISLGIAVFRTFFQPQVPSTQALIWSPFVQHDVPVLVSVCDIIDTVSKSARANWASTDAQIIATHRIPETLLQPSPMPTVSFVDASTAARVIATLGARQQKVVMQGTSNINLDNLRRGPDVLIGGFDNPWALALTSHLRFHLMVDPATQIEWIEDSRHPGRRQWELSGKTMTYMNSTSDYALVTRFHSNDTGTWVVAIEGLGLQGTEAGGELLTDPKMDSILPASLRSTKRNFQLVIKTTVINGNTSPPQILATYVW